MISTRIPIEFDPLVSGWFLEKFSEPTLPQVEGWPLIRSGENVLISAPTGSGKTLAAFLTIIDRLVGKARTSLPHETMAVYISPLKALVNDVHKNLELPLAEIRERGKKSGIALSEIRVSMRTGDTPPAERAKMLRHAPHILVTTPESLFILLTAARSREFFRTVSTVIVDEIHAVAGSKRGPHLALSLERLDRLVLEAGRPRPQRIGLSATVKPLEEIAGFLSGPGRGETKIVSIGHKREMDLSVWTPQNELGAVATNEIWEEIYDRVAEVIREHRTTLVFVGTRRLSERVTHNLVKRLGEDRVMPHHGSLARRIRLDVESRLKKGELGCVVATASLELGIDIGSVEQVAQIGSPRSIAVALQRIGRSGHWVGAKPSGTLFPTTRDELVECAALVRAIRKGLLDRLEPSIAPLDILAQQIAAACACDDWDEDELCKLVRFAYPYRDLDRRDFDAVVRMLADGVATSRGRAGALLHRDAVHHRLRGRRGARLAAITGGGAIPDATTYAVVAEPENVVVGTVDEDFAVESMSGDIFLLGTHSWRIRRVEQGRVRVEDAAGAPPSIPFWNGEAPGRTIELSKEVSDLRLEIGRMQGERDSAVRFLREDCGVDRLGSDEIADYVTEGKRALGAIPSQEQIVAERFFDESGGMQLVVHAPFGARINKAWGLALRKRFCRSFNLELQAAATDNGFLISLSDQHAFPLEIIFQFLKTATVREVLTQAMLPSPMFTARWRWNAQRALVIPRFRGGKKVPAPIQRMKNDDLLAAVFPDQAACPENLSGEVRIPDHPLVNETISNCLHEAMDLDGLCRILRGIENGTIRTLAIDTPEPSVFAHEILNANPYAFLDDAPLEERRARAVSLRSSMRSGLPEGAGLLDPAAIHQVASEVRPIARDPDELHDALLTFVLLPPVAEWEPLFQALCASGRAATLTHGGESWWVAAERVEQALLLHPDAKLNPHLRAIQDDGSRINPDNPALEAVRGWLQSGGPLTIAAVSRILGIEKDLIERALLRLEHDGRALRGAFTGNELEYCDRTILARIHRLTLGKLRREIEPVSTAAYHDFLERWQHLAPGTHLHGADGTLLVIEQLQGMEYPAESWEKEILAARVAGYKPDYLDTLCASGEVMWGRLSPYEGKSRRVRPSRVAPISLFLRKDADSIPRKRGDGEGNASLSHEAKELLNALEKSGASFFSDLLRLTRLLASQVEDGLWELVTAGLVTADGFDNLRALFDPKRRLAPRRKIGRRPRHASGRWALLPVSAKAKGFDLEACARQLLLRWGVVFYDVMKEEAIAPPWRDLLVVFRRLEDEGEVRGGRFVSGFSGEQFATSEAVELLRSVSRGAAETALS